MSGTDDGRAVRERSAFRLRYAVRTRIDAPPERVWSLLTDVARIPEWTSTVDHAEGTVEPGGRVKLRVPVAPDRVFDLKVDEVVPSERIVWSDGSFPMFRGVRTYTLRPLGDGATEFAMEEVFNGIMLPMIAGSLPDFREPFETYASDLREAAEG